MRFIDDIIGRALKEDIGPGDWTTEALIPEGESGIGEAVAREPFIVAGIDVARRVFTTLSDSCSYEGEKCDGDNVSDGKVIFRVCGPMRTLLTGERTALNFLQRLSGIASLTRKYVDRVKGHKARIADTRKTTPGWRTLEKYAVRVGGGCNHRLGLFDGILIKDNHIAACGGISRAVEQARLAAHHLLCVEVETRTLAEVREALRVGADVIMFDNMSEDEMLEAVNLVGDRAVKEASGCIDLDRVAGVAATGVDLISIGQITHSARSIDISMRIRPCT